MPYSTIHITLPFSASGYKVQLQQQVKNLNQLYLYQVRVSGLNGTPHILRWRLRRRDQGALKLVDYNSDNELVSIGTQVGLQWNETHSYPGKPLTEYYQRAVEFSTLDLEAAVDEAGNALTFTYVTFVFVACVDTTPSYKDDFGATKYEPYDPYSWQTRAGRFGQDANTAYLN